MITDNSIYIIFMGMLISDIIYQSGLLNKLNKEIFKLKSRVHEIEDKLK